ncbi:hypothetical protein HMPREF3291_22480 [Bacillus sp. HMSC76G11]|nr:hypothetical protein HMPREF3291_22480 [Bacillus sp. HMSC76G11]
MVREEKQGQVYYVHAPSRTIVSKLCPSCNAIKLVEDFEKTGTGRGIAGAKKRCKACTPKPTQKTKPVFVIDEDTVKSSFQELDVTIKKYEARIRGRK